MNTDHDLTLRRDAAQATLDEWRKRPWRLGEADCVRMIASHLRRLGHQVKLPPKGSYRTVRTALAKLDALGHADIAAALDALGFARIAPAAAIVGDIIQLPGEDEDDRLSALTVALGNGRVAGWHPDAPRGAEVLQPTMYKAAWRVELA